MHSRAPLLANAKLIASAEWQEPIRDGQQKHRRFIYLTQFGTGRMGSGPQGRKATKRALLSRAMRERAGAADAETKRQALARTARRTPPAVIWPGPSSKPQSWWRTAR